MYPPVNLILGDNNNGLDEIDIQIQKMEAYRNKLRQLQNMSQPKKKLVWDEIDAEVIPMTEEQKMKLYSDEDYVTVYNQLQNIVQAELLNLVKEKIESTSEGKDLLERQLKIVRKLKGKIIDETNREMELFRKFKEFSKTNPGITYEEFVKSNMN